MVNERCHLDDGGNKASLKTHLCAVNFPHTQILQERHTHRSKIQRRASVNMICDMQCTNGNKVYGMRRSSTSSWVNCATYRREYYYKSYDLGGGGGGSRIIASSSSSSRCTTVAVVVSAVVSSVVPTILAVAVAAVASFIPSAIVVVSVVPSTTALKLKVLVVLTREETSLNSVSAECSIRHGTSERTHLVATVATVASLEAILAVATTARSTHGGSTPCSRSARGGVTASSARGGRITSSSSGGGGLAVDPVFLELYEIVPVNGLRCGGGDEMRT